MEKVTVEQAEMVVDCAADFGFYDLEVREGYSGRGMYGSEVVAITGDDTDGVRFAVGVLIGRGELDEDAVDWFRRSDSMGRGSVVY